MYKTNRYRIMKASIKNGESDTELCIVYTLDEALALVKELREASGTSIYYYNEY